MAPSLLFFKRIYAECTNEKTPNRIREPAFFKSDGTPIQKTRFFDQLESRLKMKPKNVIFLGENHLDPNSHLLELEILKATFFSQAIFKSTVYHSLKVCFAQVETCHGVNWTNTISGRAQ